MKGLGAWLKFCKQQKEKARVRGCAKSCVHMCAVVVMEVRRKRVCMRAHKRVGAGDGWVRVKPPQQPLAEEPLPQSSIGVQVPNSQTLWWRSKG